MPPARKKPEARPLREVERCKEAALKRLAPRARSVEELRGHLASKDFSTAAIETTITDLTRAGLLSDEALARDVARETLERAPAGRMLLEHKLHAREVEEPAAQRALDETTRGRSESADALALARLEAPRIVRDARADPHAAARRLLALLCRRGFEEHDAREAALRALRELGADPADE